MELPFIDWSPVVHSLGRIAVSYVLALPIAWDRERGDRSAGLRTFPLVAIAATAYTLLATQLFPDSPEAQARVVQGLITGIGFVGAGAILRDGGKVRGTATAAAIWGVGALGAAVAFGRFEIALVLSLVNFATLRVLGRLKHEGDEPPRP